MRQKARKELAKKGVPPSEDKAPEKEKKPPSMISGFFLIFAGSIVFSFFLTAGQPFLGILASAAFIILGMSRLIKANAARYKPSKMEN